MTRFFPDSFAPDSAVPLPSPSRTYVCSKCDALVSLHNVRCNRCGTYIHAGPVENAVLRTLVPDGLARYAGTSLLAFVILAWYAVAILATRGDALPVASSFTLRRFGAMDGPSLLYGQWWRAFTSVFMHHDLLHLAMNLWALRIVAPLLESLRNRYTVAMIFLLGGALSMLLSHAWYAIGLFGAPYIYVSAGASGAVCALIGATWSITRKFPETQPIAKQMLVWSGIMLIFGLGMSANINNAAHIGGWIAGVALAQLDLRLIGRPAVLKGMVAVLITVTLSSFALAGLNLRGLPTYLVDDGQGRSMMFLWASPGVAWERSSQVMVWNACSTAVIANETSPAAIESTVSTCRTNAAISPFSPASWTFLAASYERAGDHTMAQRAARVARRLSND